MATNKKPAPSEDGTYTKCTGYSLLQKREKKKPAPSGARLSEEHFNQWRFINLETSKTLYKLALGGDENAAALLHLIAFNSVELLRELAIENPAVLVPISEYQIQWPTLWCKKDYLKEENKKIMEELRLGEKSRLTGKFNLKSPATQTALKLLSWLQQNRERLGLPFLTQSTREEWFQAGWKRHLHETQGHPENHEYMREPVEMAARNEVKRNQDNSNLKTVIARRIKSGVKQGFKSITAKAS